MVWLVLVSFQNLVMANGYEIDMSDEITCRLDVLYRCQCK